MDYSFFIAGEPRPKGSKGIINQGGKFRLVEAADLNKGRSLKRWMAACAIVCRRDMREPLKGAVEVQLAFFMKRGKTVKRPVPITRPDVDKLVRGVLDGLQGAAYMDDSRVLCVMVTKDYADHHPEGCLVRVVDLDHPDQMANMKRKMMAAQGPVRLGDVAVGEVVLTPFGAGGYFSRVRVAWHWKDGSVCVRPLQYRGCVEHCTLPGDLRVKAKFDGKFDSG